MSFGRRYLESLTAGGREALPFEPRPGSEVSWWRRYLASLTGLPPAGPARRRAAVAPTRDRRFAVPPPMRRFATAYAYKQAAAPGAPVAMGRIGGPAPAMTSRRVVTFWVPLGAAVVALVAVLMFRPHGGEPGDNQGGPTPGQIVPGESPPVVASRVGCREVHGALDAYRATAAGRGPEIRAGAAREADRALTAASTSADPAIRPEIVELAGEFRELALILDGTASGDPAQSAKKLDADAARLELRCPDSGVGPY
ncbi:hypothetical protein ACFV4P_02195 [Kitasatospora sp. NPDC059795]|uniref:hypothetical protein n=1 Tax=Kitasatospora sp. NPDC059795 TaxID=3346949 RepID=UPI0036693BA7